MKSKKNFAILVGCVGSLLAISPVNASGLPRILGATVLAADLPTDVVGFLAANPVLGVLTAGGSFSTEGSAYRVALTNGAELALAKNSSGKWFAVLGVNKGALGKLFPSTLLEGELSSGVLVVGSGGKVESSALPADGGFRDLVSGYAFGSDVTGVEFRARLNVNEKGAFGALVKAGFIPAETLVLTGKLGGAAAGSLFGVAAGDDASVDLELAVPAFIPKPYSSSDSNRVEYGATKYVFAGTTKQLTIAGKQTGAKIVLGKTVTTLDLGIGFSAVSGGFDVAAYGTAKLGSPIASLFGIPGLTVTQVSLSGTAASGGNFSSAARVSGALKGNPYDATMSALVDGGMLVDVGLELSQAITFPLGAEDSMTLAAPRIGIAPSSTQGYLTASSAKLKAKGFTFDVTQPGIVAGPSGVLALGKLSKLNLNQLFLPTNSPAVFPALNQATIAFATASLPVPAGLTRKLGAVEVPSGLGLRISTELDLERVAVTKKLGKVGIVRLGGELSQSQFSLDAELPGGELTVPGFDALTLGSPKVHLAYHDQISEVGVAGTMNLALSSDAAPVVLEGMLFVDSRGAFAASGNLKNKWTNPVGLTPTTLGPNTRVSIAIDPIGVNVGFQAAGSVKATSYDEVGLCLGFGPTGIKGIGLALKAEEISAQTALDVFDVVVDALAKASGPLAKTAPGNPWNAALTAASTGSQDSSAYLATVPQLVVKNGVLRVLTPGALCPGLPAFNALGGELAGEAVARLPSADVPLGSGSAAIGLEEFAFAAKTARSYVLAEQLTLETLDIDIQALIPGGAKFTVADPGHFRIKTSAKVLDAKAALDVSLDSSGGSFEFDGTILSLGTLRLSGKTTGTSLVTSKDVRLGIAASDIEKSRRAALRSLSRGMVQASEDLYQFEKDVSSTQEDLEANIDRLENKIDDLNRDLSKALSALSSWGKDQCVTARKNGDKVGIEICKGVYPILDGLEDAARDLRKARTDLSVFKQGADYLYVANKKVNQGARGVLTTVASALQPDPSLFTMDAVAFEAVLSARGAARLRVQGTVSGLPYDETIPVNLDDPVAGANAAFTALGKKLIQKFETEARKSGTPAQKATAAANPGSFERVGAAVKWSGSVAYVFDVTRYERLDTNDSFSIDSGYPKSVSVWKGCTTCYGADAVFESGDFAYIFRAGEVLKWSKGTDLPMGEAAPIATLFPTLPAPFRDGIEAAERLGDRIYLFEGAQVIALNPTTFAVLPGYPKAISAEFTIDAGFATGFDSALLGENGKAYFFKGNSYIRIDIATKKQDAGYPKVVKGNW